MSSIIKISGRTGGIKVKIKGDGEDDTAANHEPSQEEYFQKQLHNNFEKGKTEGYNKARKEFEESFKRELIKRAEEFEKILRTLENNLKGYEEVFDKIVINVAVLIAEKLVKHEIDKNSTITNNLKESIRKVLGANDIRIKLNPKDHEIINSDGKNLILDESYSKIKFELDKNIEPGGCYIETEIGNVDSRMSTQLSEIRRQLETSFINPVL
jgi:flagellar assembly protein FliH